MSSALEVQFQRSAWAPWQPCLGSQMCIWLCDIMTFCHVFRWRLARRQKQSLGVTQKQPRHVQIRQHELPRKKNMHLVSAVAALALIGVSWRDWRATSAARRQMKSLPRFTLPDWYNRAYIWQRSQFSACSDDVHFQNMQKRQHALHQLQMLQELQQKQKHKKSSRCRNETRSRIHLAVPTSPICCPRRFIHYQE